MMGGMTALLSIGDLAERTGVAVRTIRFYSDSGVLPRPTGPAPATGCTARTRSRGSGWCARCATSGSISRPSGACSSAR